MLELRALQAKHKNRGTQISTIAAHLNASRAKFVRVDATGNDKTYPQSNFDRLLVRLNRRSQYKVTTKDAPKDEGVRDVFLLHFTSEPVKNPTQPLPTP